MRTVLALDNVTKVFKSQFHGGLKSLIVNPGSVWNQEKQSGFTAVDKVSFEVMEGQTFGVIGRNGAGKSTILGLIGGILTPTHGTVTIRGRVSPLLELGVGFTPELDGRENIVLNGVLLGLRRRQIEAEIERIIEFSGLRDFIDQSLKTYSSGMQMRLGFSIAVHAHPDILLVDEVLAVGDAEFQEKCLHRIGELHRQGVTIVFVSHDLTTLQSVCDRAVWIDHGRLMAIGSAKEVVDRYRDDVLGGHRLDKEAFLNTK